MITVISKNNCPQCKMTKNFLDSNHIPYEEHNINQEPEYIDKMHELGLYAAPVVINGKDIFTGFNMPKLHKLAYQMQNQTAEDNQLNSNEE